MDYNFDLIIPIYNLGSRDYEYRLNNIKTISSSIPENINLIIVEQKNKKEKTYKENLEEVVNKKNVNYISVKYDGMFNKGWLNNIGARNSLTNNIIIGESDCVSEDKLLFEKLKKHLSDNKGIEWLYLWDQILYMNKDKTSVLKKFKRPNGTGVDGGLLYFNKKSYFNIGGSNEWMDGLGCIDNDLKVRSSFLLHRERKIPGTIYHLWHPGSGLKGSKRESEFFISRRTNKKMYRMLVRRKKQISDYLKKYSDNIGGKLPLVFEIPLSKTIYKLDDKT